MILVLQEDQNPLAEFETLRAETKNFSGWSVFTRFSNKEGILRRGQELSRTLGVTSKTSPSCKYANLGELSYLHDDIYGGNETAGVRCLQLQSLVLNWGWSQVSSAVALPCPLSHVWYHRPLQVSARISDS